MLAQAAWSSILARRGPRPLILRSPREQCAGFRRARNLRLLCSSPPLVSEPNHRLAPRAARLLSFCWPAPRCIFCSARPAESALSQPSGVTHRAPVWSKCFDLTGQRRRPGRCRRRALPGVDRQTLALSDNFDRDYLRSLRKRLRRPAWMRARFLHRTRRHSNSRTPTSCGSCSKAGVDQRHANLRLRAIIRFAS